MKSLAIILALAFASPALADAVSTQPTATCTPPAPKKKVVRKAKPAAKPEVKKEPECNQTVTVVVVPPEPQVKEVVRTVTKTQVVFVEAKPKAEPKGPDFGIGVLGEVGTMVKAKPHVFGLLGVRGRWFPAHLGLELDTQFYWGHAAKLMVYPIQGPLAWHLDVGMLWVPHLGFGAQDVPRKWDLTAGTGIEWNFAKNLSLTADWRVSLPNPVTIHKYDRVDANGRYINVGNTIGNSFAGSQLLVGVMYHTW